jgi:saccharopine dehydrogenase-like NADP-dependent oxidoreductase
MSTILIAGAGKSSSNLIHYILAHAPHYKWKVIVADGSAAAIHEKINGNPFAHAAVIDITQASERTPLVKEADIVISLMPPHLHILLAKDCLQYKKNLITSSYISPEMKEMDREVKEAGLMFMCEMGLDPGIDHMTATKLIHSIHRVSGVVSCFKSYCGGLIAPESDNNPWHYKFTWNPRNVITAGFGGASYMINGKHIEVPYEKMFEQNKKVKVGDIGQLAYYANRDSMRYLDIYNVPEVQTFMRATLRHPAFCKGWQALILLGLTRQDDAFETQGMTWNLLLRQKTGYNGEGSLRVHVAATLGIAADDKVMPMLQWLGIFDEKPLKEGKHSSADVLLELLLEKWHMEPEDKDMVAMMHELEYLHKGKKAKVTCAMVIKGDNREYSAMSKTVGLPIAVLSRLVLNKKIVRPTGVLLPNMPSVYRPVLTELAHYGIEFHEMVG